MMSEAGVATLWNGQIAEAELVPTHHLHIFQQPVGGLD
jgi:hypothetical protein